MGYGPIIEKGDEPTGAWRGKFVKPIEAGYALMPRVS
jgi:hypothetical protein